MEPTSGGVPLHRVERGDGLAVLVLHGAGVDHREVLGCLDPVFAAAASGPAGGYRRIYPDLPGMGRSPAPPTIRSADDVLEVLLGLVDAVVGDAPLLVVGHSAGAYYAQAIAGHRPGQVAGLALLCPLLPGAHDVPEHEAVHGHGSIGDAEFRDYFTVQTPQMLHRYQTYVEPGARSADWSALERIGRQWEVTAPSHQAPFLQPTLLVTGRQDSTVGYQATWELLGHYPHATFAVLDGAGHALPHEQPELVRALVTEWLDRVRARG